MKSKSETSFTHVIGIMIVTGIVIAAVIYFTLRS